MGIQTKSDLEAKKSLKIAILGTRGIPACYGGFETFAEELSSRLVQRGYEVTVYGRRPFFSKYKGLLEYKRVKIRVSPTIMHKYLETPLHSLTSFIDILFRKFDVILLCNAANSPFSFLAKLRRVPLAINVDGVERKRKKWNWLGKLWYRLGEFCSVVFADVVIADARVIAWYYRRAYGARPVMIAYGARTNRRAAGRVLAQFGLKEKGYLLYVSRLEPENNALGVIEAYKGLPSSSMPLVIVGDAPFADQYKEVLKQTAASSNVIFTGFQFGAAYEELQSNCYLYIQATEVGGTHPALIEAMAYGNCVIANSTPEHIEVLRKTGWYYKKNNFFDLRTKLEELMSRPELVRSLGEKAKERAEKVYSWDAIIDQYEHLFCRMVSKGVNEERESPSSVGSKLTKV